MLPHFFLTPARLARRPAPQDTKGDIVAPAVPANAHVCNYFGNFFDGRWQLNTNNTGARARIGYVGNGLVPICNPQFGLWPPSASSSWSMMADHSCAPWGYFQVGYARANFETESGGKFLPENEYYFRQNTNCDGSGLKTSILKANATIWSSSHCYTVTYSGLLQKWIAEVGRAPCGSGSFVVQWQIPQQDINFSANSVKFFGETFDYWQAPGASGQNSDSMCGYSYNKCTWQQTQRRDLAGVWHNASTTGYFTPGGHCGYGQVVNSSTSFAIWTNFTGC